MAARRSVGSTAGISGSEEGPPGVRACGFVEQRKLRASLESCSFVSAIAATSSVGVAESMGTPYSINVSAGGTGRISVRLLIVESSPMF